MIKYQLIINPFAEIDLYDAKKWYDLQKENLGSEFIQETENTIFQIKNNPFQFPLIKSKIHRAVVSRFPYSIFFYVDENIINVFAIFHTHRNPVIWKERFKAE